MGGAGRGEERRREEEADSEEKPFWPFLTSSVSVAVSSSLPPDQITAPVFSRVNTKAHQDQTVEDALMLRRQPERWRRVATSRAHR